MMIMKRSKHIRTVQAKLSPYVIPGILMIESYSTDKAAILLKRVAVHYDVPVSKLVSKDRKADLTYIRQLFAYFVYHHFDDSTTAKYKSVGLLLGGRDRTTVMNMVYQFTARLETNARVYPTVKGMARRTKDDYLLTIKFLQECSLESLGK